MVRQPAVVLLRHAPVEAPEPRLEVADGDLELDRRQRRRKGRVDVARNDDEVGPPVEEDLLEARQRAGRLGAVHARAHGQLSVRPRQGKLVEEEVGDLAVVVLPGVDEPLLDDAAPLERGVHRRDLHVVRPSADHVDDKIGPPHLTRC